jgi:hypothetical protein
VYHRKVTTLVRSGPPHESDLDALRLRLTDVEAALAAQRSEIDRIETSLAAFRIRYRRDVGRLHDRLDELECAIAEAELGEISKRLGDTEPPPAPLARAADPQPQYTSDAVRRLFRDVAKTIHPDLAQGVETRDRRHALMIEANRAYALGDEEELRRILEAWSRSPEAVEGSDPEAMRLRLVRRIAEIEQQLEDGVRELADLNDTPLGKLKAMVDAEAVRGKDLVYEMIGRLKRDIRVAQNRLDAIRSPP